MKNYLTCALLASLCLVALPGCKKSEEAEPPASAKAPAPEAPAQTPAPQTPTPEATAAPTDHIGLSKAIVANISTICTTLDSVKDKASADAAANTLTPVCKELKTLIETFNALEPAQGKTAASVNIYKGESGKMFGEMIGKLGHIAPHYYGSESLKALFESM